MNTDGLLNFYLFYQCGRRKSGPECAKELGRNREGAYSQSARVHKIFGNISKAIRGDSIQKAEMRIKKQKCLNAMLRELEADNLEAEHIKKFIRKQFI